MPHLGVAPGEATPRCATLVSHLGFGTQVDYTWVPHLGAAPGEANPQVCNAGAKPRFWNPGGLHLGAAPRCGTW